MLIDQLHRETAKRHNSTTSEAYELSLSKAIHGTKSAAGQFVDTLLQIKNVINIDEKYLGFQSTYEHREGRAIEILPKKSNAESWNVPLPSKATTTCNHPSH